MQRKNTFPNLPIEEASARLPLIFYHKILKDFHQGQPERFLEFLYVGVILPVFFVVKF